MAEIRMGFVWDWKEWGISGESYNSLRVSVIWEEGFWRQMVMIVYFMLCAFTTIKFKKIRTNWLLGKTLIWSSLLAGECTFRLWEQGWDTRTGNWNTTSNNFNMHLRNAFNLLNHKTNDDLRVWISISWKMEPWVRHLCSLRPKAVNKTYHLELWPVLIHILQCQHLHINNNTPVVHKMSCARTCTHVPSK